MIVAVDPKRSQTARHQAALAGSRFIPAQSVGAVAMAGAARAGRAAARVGLAVRAIPPIPATISGARKAPRSGRAGFRVLRVWGLVFCGRISVFPREDNLGRGEWFR